MDTFWKILGFFFIGILVVFQSGCGAQNPYYNAGFKYGEAEGYFITCKSNFHMLRSKRENNIDFKKGRIVGYKSGSKDCLPEKIHKSRIAYGDVWKVFTNHSTEHFVQWEWRQPNDPRPQPEWGKEGRNIFDPEIHERVKIVINAPAPKYMYVDKIHHEKTPLLNKPKPTRTKEEKEGREKVKAIYSIIEKLVSN